MSDYVQDTIQREIDRALNPVGMSTHSGTVRLEISHVQHLLRRIEHTENALRALATATDRAFRRSNLQAELDRAYGILGDENE